MNNETDLEIYILSLINSLIIDNEVSEDYEELLDNMTLLLNDNPSLYDIINKSKFLTHHFILCLRNDESCLNFLTLHIDHLTLPELYFTKKFIFFITDKLYEKLYQNYNPILEFISKLINKNDSIISLLYDCGFFCLLNGIIDTRTCKIYNEIFRNRIHLSKNTQKITNDNKDCFYEVHRKQFDSEIIFNENNLIKFKTFIPYKKGSVIHNKIYENLANTSLYNLIICDFNEMDNVINYKKNDYEFIIDNEDLILGCYEKKPSYIRIVRMYYKDQKALADTGFYKKISKFLDDKNLILRYETLLCLSLYEDLMINFSEKKIRSIFELLEFSITECINCDEEECDGECTLLSILDMLYKIYTTHNKMYFFKISYLILLREISKRIVHKFIAEYFKDIIEYFRERKNNISRVLFPYSLKRGAKVNIETPTIIDEDELRESEEGNKSDVDWEEEGETTFKKPTGFNRRRFNDSDEGNAFDGKLVDDDHLENNNEVDEEFEKNEVDEKLVNESKENDVNELKVNDVNSKNLENNENKILESNNIDEDSLEFISSLEF